jgi:hypothetical protein
MILFGGVDDTGYLAGSDPDASLGTSLFLQWTGASWSAVSTSFGPSPRAYAASANTANGVLLFSGGDGVFTVFPDTWLWSGSSWQRVDSGASTPARTDAGMAAWGTSVVLFGGYDVDSHTLGDTWIWDGSTWTSVPTQDDGPEPRHDPMMATLNGQVVLFGGFDASGMPLGDTWIWDGSWTLGPAAGPTARGAAMMTAY